MDGAQGSSNSTPPFLTKTYEMVDDPSSDSIVSWSMNGRSFVVWNPPDFARDLLPKYFKHNNFSSFVRQLNTYGFRKIDPEQWEFGNEEFVRGQRHLLKNIHRRKPIHSHSTSNLANASQLSESEKHEYEDEIERLQQDKNSLILELQSQIQEKKEIQFQLQSLGERVVGMEHQQQKLIAFLSQLLQKPGFSFTLMQQSEIRNKRRRLSIPHYFYDEDDMKENRQIMNLQDKPDTDSTPLSTFKLVEKLETSLTFWEFFLNGIGQDSGIVDITEANASYEDPDMNNEPCSPKSHLHSPDLRDIHSSPGVSGSTNPEDSPGISTIYLDNDDNRPKLSIDVNSKPTIAPDVESEEQAVEAVNSATRAGANDVFWEQFLTETPGSARTQEVQSESRDTTGSSKKSDSKPAEHGKFWWNMNNVNNLTEKMGHLTPAEKT